MRNSQGGPELGWPSGDDRHSFPRTTATAGYGRRPALDNAGIGVGREVDRFTLAWATARGASFLHVERKLSHQAGDPGALSR